jgi:hypothetical protein
MMFLILEGCVGAADIVCSKLLTTRVGVAWPCRVPTCAGLMSRASMFAFGQTGHQAGVTE